MNIVAISLATYHYSHLNNLKLTFITINSCNNYR